MHKRAIAPIRVLSVGGRSGARRTLRRRSSARASNRPRAPAPISSSTWPGMKASLTSAGFGAQSAIAIAHSARPGGRDQAHRVDHWSAPRAHHSRAAREPRVPRAPQAPGPRRRCPRTWQAAGQQRVEVPRPARRRPRNCPACERPIAIHQPLPADLDHVHDAEHPDTPTTRPSHTAHTTPPAANADTAPPQRPRQPATRDKQPSHQIRRPPSCRGSSPSPDTPGDVYRRCGARHHRFVAEGVVRQADQLTIAFVAKRSSAVGERTILVVTRCVMRGNRIDECNCAPPAAGHSRFGRIARGCGFSPAERQRSPAAPKLRVRSCCFRRPSRTVESTSPGAKLPRFARRRAI